MTTPGTLVISESTIRQNATADAYSRGQQYERRGAVTSLVRRGDLLYAQVEGSADGPYRVRITLAGNSAVAAASCSCPYDWGGWCKHIVAALLTAIHQPESVEERPALDALLGALEREQLQELLLRLANRDPDIADAIELQAALVRAAPPPAPDTGASAAPARRAAPIDVQAVRRQVRATIRESAFDYSGRADPLEQLEELLEQARRFSEAGEGQNAIGILQTITEECLDQWDVLSEFGDDISALFEELGAAWAEAILTADLTRAERREWAEQFATWQDDLRHYGLEVGFAMARVAAEQGWDTPAIQRVFRGEISRTGIWEGEPPDFADELARMRLEILERQGRDQEYLYLAEAEGQIAHYLIKLARLGRTAQAVDEGLRYLTTANDALMLAKALQERGELRAALRIAQHGLTLAEPRAELAAWLSGLAERMGRHDVALRAAELSFRSAPSPEMWERLEALAGENWPALQPRLLDALRQAGPRADPEVVVELFLRAGALDDAIAAVQGNDGRLLDRVLDVAIARRPEWAAQAAIAQADRIINAGDAQRYDLAVHWLRRAREAYRAMGRPGDWQVYLSALRAAHGRKHKLMGLLGEL